MVNIGGMTHVANAVVAPRNCLQNSTNWVDHNPKWYLRIDSSDYVDPGVRFL